MADTKSIQRGFTKQAQLYGLTEVQAKQLFKLANDPMAALSQPAQGGGLASMLGQGAHQAGSWLGDKAEQGMGMFKDFREQNPAAMDAGIGGLVGGTAGSLMGGPQNRGKGALIGATAGAGLGGLGMHPGAMQQLQQLLGGSQQGAPPGFVGPHE